MVGVHTLFWLHFIIFLRDLCTIAQSVRPERKLAKSDMNLTHDDKSTAFEFPLSQRQMSEEDLSEKIHQRTVRSLKNITETKNRTEDPFPREIIRLVNITLPPIIFKILTLPSVFVTAPPVQAKCSGTPYSCSGRCSNETIFVRYSSFGNRNYGQKCKCDSACNLFMDCCGDFPEQCGKYSVKDKIDDVYSYRSSWRCETNLTILNDGCATTRGVWMISRCPSNWQNDSTKTMCHFPPSILEAQSFDSFIPVVGLANHLTYRNQYCAQCNNVSNYEFMTLIFDKETVPPPYYTPEGLKKFIAENHHKLRSIEPKDGQAMRFCHYPNVVSTCRKTLANARDACINGGVGLVEGEDKVFKNKNCALCNGVRYTCAVRRPVHHCTGDPKSINRAISLRDYGVSLETKSCPQHQVYDPYLGRCRQNYEVSKLRKGDKDKYQVILSVLKLSHRSSDPRSSRMEIARYFNMNESQITINEIVEKFSEILLTFTLYLTPSQSLIMASDPQFRGNSTQTIGLRRLFKFQEAFELLIDGSKLTVYQLRFRQLVCIHRHVYRFGEYTILDDLRIRVNSSGGTYEQNEYYLNTTNTRPNVTVCLKLAPLKCNGSYIKLNSSEYNFLPNLTLVYNSVTYVFGDYSYTNGTVFVCVEFEKNYTKSRRNEPKDDLALIIITWFGFILSIICLSALFITYLIFKELRTLPGKNLMSLSISLCLAEMLWLCGSSSVGSRTACIFVAVANHYFFLVFFIASSVIAFHSCLVFGQKVTFRRSKSEDNKTFLIYSLVVWGIPALFVLVSFLLDHYGVFVSDYGKSDICWLGTRKSRLYLFILPFGILLLFNLLLFVFVALRLHKNQKSQARVLGKDAKKQQRQNVLVCVKLSTLMGFSWLFGLLQIAVESETDVFSYLFAIFVSFQGLFICVAFLFKRTCYHLYSTMISKTISSSSGSGLSAPSNKSKSNKQNLHEETRL